MRQPNPVITFGMYGALALSLIWTEFDLIAKESGFQSVEQQRYDILITTARVMDGTGNPWFSADIGIRDGVIVAVGKLSDASAVRIIEAKSKYVTPGFIDLHSHADDVADRGSTKGLRATDPKRRAAPNLVSQGATTVVVNQDGRSPYSIAEQRAQLEEMGFGPNTILLVGHNTIRAMAMASDPKAALVPEEISKMQREATVEEVERMRHLVWEGMKAGAYGVSAGLEYLPGRWSNTEEVVAVVEEMVPFGGVFICHERSSGTDPMWYFPSYGGDRPPSFLDNIVELIEVGERTGATVVATHIKARGAHFWGSGRAAVQMIERARKRGVQIWADQYPYNTTGSDGRTRLIPSWVFGNRTASFVRTEDKVNYAHSLQQVLNDAGTVKKMRADITHEIVRRGGAENIMVMDYPDSSFIGKTIAQLSKELELLTVDLAIKLQLDGFPDKRGGARLRGFSLSEIDVELYGAQAWTATASDAGIALPGDGAVHARFYGTFPRKIRKYALERKVISVEHAVRSATSLPAQILGFRNRGLIREGFHADLVVFDLDELRDTATFFEPHQYANGIEYVLVNGIPVVDRGELTWALPGTIITPDDAQQSPKVEPTDRQTIEPKSTRK
ncbi:amidohydrolase family protein [bacterium]|nr:amidohydrolase family protein [bacterium]